MSPISIIGCIVGVVGCLIGIATFSSAMITKAKQDGVLMAKVEQCLKNTEEIKKDMKEKNKEYDSLLDKHSKEIVELQTQMKSVLSKINTE